jgi:8-oxo-dGTP pyrophosphatase MutT (NUDIX family)
MEHGETAKECLRRELQEELGLSQFVVGPLVWRRQHTFEWAGRSIRQREQYYVVRVEKFEPRMSDAAEAAHLERFQWWSAAELFSAPERLTPLSLADIVARYIREGAPSAAIDVEVVPD